MSTFRMPSVVLGVILVIASVCGDNHNPADYEVTEGDVYVSPHMQLIRAQKQAEALSNHLPNLSLKVIEGLSSLNPRQIVEDAINLDVSPPCRDALQVVVDGFNVAPTDLWALKFIDSWGKVGSGLLSGHQRFPGNYDQCKNLTAVQRVLVNKTISEEPDFITNYCVVHVPIVAKLVTVQLGVCTPSQCNATDVRTFYNFALSKLPVISLSASSVNCQPLNRTLTPGRTAALVFVIVMICIAVLATIYDGIQQLRDGWNAEMSEKGERMPLLGSVTQSKSKSISSKQDKLDKTILAFSFYSNACKILNTDQPAGALTCLNGIRFFSMTWVILGHSLMMISFGAKMNNLVFINELKERFSFEVIANATVSVDTFFVLSGLLVSYLFLKDFHKRQIEKKGFFKALPVIYLHRYFRLTPAYGIMIMIYTCLVWYIGDGPFWPMQHEAHSQTMDLHCQDYWYLNILYVNNLFKLNSQCAPWGWYLANDMQFFLIAPFIVYIIYLSNYIGLAVCTLTVLGSIAAAIGVSDEQGTIFATSPLAHHNFTTIAHPDLPYYNEPWSRYQTYGIGLITGFLIWKLQKINFKIPKVLNIILWGVSAGICMSVVYGPHAANMGYHIVYIGEADMYNGFARTAWAIGISYVMLSCSLGQGGWVNEFLSWRGFVPLSRLTYSAYLIHIPIIVTLFFGVRTGTYYTDMTIVQDIVTTITISFFMAFIFSTLFEAPFINLDRIFLAPLSLRRKQDENSSHSTTKEGNHSQASNNESINAVKT